MEGCEEWYNNSHNVIDQFVYQRALMMCSVCDEKLSARLFDGEPVCPDCADVSLASSSDDKSSSTVRTPKVLNLDVLKSRALVHVKKGGDKIFCKPGHHVDEEYVIVSGGRNHELGFIAGNAALNQKAADAFLRSAKSAVFDIESVPVDSTLLRKIPDEIVSLQIVTDTGGAFGEPIIFTRRLPTCWDDGGLHDTAEFLKDVLTEEQIKGLRDKSGEVPLVKVFPVKSEKALVDGFVQFMKVYRPHFLVSYNGEGFDLKFLLRASVATEYADSLDDVLDHLKTNCVTRLNSMSRGLTPHIREGFKRGGWLCRGLISDERLEVDYTLFPCVIGVDLFKLEHCSLADACAKRNVSVGKLDAVKHKDIPRLYYGRDPKFWQYALLDPIATRELLNKLRFQAIEIYPTMEDLTGTPWNLSMSMKKTQNAVTTRMIQFMSRGFVTPAVIRPKRLLARHVVRLLADYFFRDVFPPDHDASQMVTDFANGQCKCNTSFKKYDKVLAAQLNVGGPHEVCPSYIKRVVAFHRQNCVGRRQFSTVDVCVIMHYVSRIPECYKRVSDDVVSFGALLNEFQSKFDKKVRGKRRLFLAKYLAYLLEVRVQLSRGFECPDLLWKLYRKYYKMDALTPDLLRKFVKVNHDRIIDAVIATCIPDGV